MIAQLINSSDLSFALAALSIVLCPALCAVMAYRTSRSSAVLRSASR